MKFLMIGHVIDRQEHPTIDDMKEYIQKKLDTWLGKNDDGESAFKLESVTEETPYRYSFVFKRKYGDFYRWIEDESIFSYDQQVIFGTDFQYGTQADFSVLPGRYIIRYGIADFELEYKRLCREKHCSRIKSVEFSETTDQISLTIEAYGGKHKPKNP